MLGMCGSDYCSVLFIFCSEISLFTVVIYIIVMTNLLFLF